MSDQVAEQVSSTAGWTPVRIKAVTLRGVKMLSEFNVRGQTGRPGDWIVAGENGVPVLVPAERFAKLYEVVPRERHLSSTPVAPVDVSEIVDKVTSAVRWEVSALVVSLREIMMERPVGGSAVTPLAASPTEPAPPSTVIPLMMDEGGSSNTSLPVSPQDEVIEFLTRETLPQRGSMIHPTDLYQAYLAYARRPDSKATVIPQPQFSARVARFGWKRKHRGHEKVWANRALIHPLPEAVSTPPVTPQIGPIIAGPIAPPSGELAPPPLSETDLAELDDPQGDADDTPPPP